MEILVGVTSRVCLLTDICQVKHKLEYVHMSDTFFTEKFNIAYFRMSFITCAFELFLIDRCARRP